MADFVWPGLVLKPADAKYFLNPMNTSGGIGFDGSEQTIGNTPGRGKLTLKNIYLTTQQQILAWNAIEAALMGRAANILVPIFDYPRAPWPLDDNGNPITLVSELPFSDGATFTDSSGFSYLVINATTVGDIPEGATSGVIQMNYGSPLQAGHHWEFAEYVYRISQVTSTAVVGGLTQYSVNFRLPARTDIPDGSQLNFDDPKVVCRLASDDSMDLKNGLRLWRRAAADLVFYEDV